MLWKSYAIVISLFYDWGPYHIEASLLISSANQWAGFSMIGRSVTKALSEV